MRVGGTTTEKISVNISLRQCCMLAPSLFNFYNIISTMMTYWRARYPEVGIMVMYKHSRRLVGDRTAKSHLDRIIDTESQFADDAAVYSTSQSTFKGATQIISILYCQI